MKVISLNLCPFVQQVRTVLESKNAPYDVEHIELGAPRPSWLLEASPDGGEVPVLVTGDGQTLFQSDTIIDYIDEVVGKPLLKGSPFERAREKAWARLASENYLTQCATQRSPDAETFEERLADLTPIFQATEAQLNEGPYFKGRALSMVDLSWLPLLHRTGIIHDHTGYDFLADFPKLQEWRLALLETGLQDCSVSAGFYEQFKEFYLNDETFLGTHSQFTTHR